MALISLDIEPMKITYDENKPWSSVTLWVVENIRNETSNKRIRKMR